MFHVKHSLILRLKEMFDEVQTTLRVQQKQDHRQGGQKAYNRHGQGKAHPTKLAAQGVVFALNIPKVATAGSFFLCRGRGMALGKIDEGADRNGVLRHFLQAFVTKHLRFAQFLAAFHAAHAVTSRKVILSHIIQQKKAPQRALRGSSFSQN